MDPIDEEILKHLEKQDELLMDACRSLSHEWQKLKAEEDMLMHTFSDFMAAQGRTTKKQGGTDVYEKSKPPQSKAAVNVDFAGCPDINDEWVTDSACTYHMSSHKEWFTTFKPVHNAGYVLDFDNTLCKIRGIGTVQMKMFDGTIRTLTDVRYIPKMKRNIISLGVFHD